MIPQELPSLPKVGERVDRYDVLEPLAHGGMAAVYAVRRAGIGGFDKVLAMKLLLPQLCTDGQHVSMFLDEARIAARIAHPNVVQVIDVGQWHAIPYLVMEYLRGAPLHKLIRHAAENDPLPVPFCIEVLAQAAEGLHAAHETCGADGEPLGIVHRDVSPQNIVVLYAGDVKVVDFGIAAARGRAVLTRSDEIRGKLAYMAPEQITKSVRVDRRADVWALGVISWEMLTGERLFRDDDDPTTMWNVIHREVPILGKRRSDLPRMLLDTIQACLVRDPEGRAPDAGWFARQLHAAASELGAYRRADLAAEMERRFGEQARREAGRFVSLEPAPTQRVLATDPAEATGTATNVTADRGLVPTARASPATIGVVLGVCAALGTALWILRSDERPAATVTDAAPEPSAPASVPTSAPTVVASGIASSEPAPDAGVTKVAPHVQRPKPSAAPASSTDTWRGGPWATPAPRR